MCAEDVAFDACKDVVVIFVYRCWIVVNPPEKVGGGSGSSRLTFERGGTLYASGELAGLFNRQIEHGLPRATTQSHPPVPHSL